MKPLDVGHIIEKRALMEHTAQKVTGLEILQIAPDGSINIASGKSDLSDVLFKGGRVVLTTVFTGGEHEDEKPQYEIGEGYIKVIREGNKKRFVNKIDAVSLSASAALKEGTQLVYVTERCVFQLEEEGLVLTEIAPGMDIQKDILDQMEFIPGFSQNLKPMAQEIFHVYSE